MRFQHTISLVLILQTDEAALIAPASILGVDLQTHAMLSLVKQGWGDESSPHPCFTAFSLG